jgi:hypothetical protein
MRHEIVKDGNLYVIVIEGQSIMKFRSRRQAMKLVAALTESERKTDRDEPTSSAA